MKLISKTEIIIVLALSSLLVGCASMNPFAGIANPPQEPKKIATYAQSEKQIPLKVGVTPDGKDVIAFQTERTYTAGSSETREKLGFMQRIGRWIGGLSLFAIVFILIALAFFGGAPILWAVNKYYTVKNALKKVVAGVDELADKDKEAQEALKSELSKKMDTTEKTLIKTIKTEL